MRVTCDKCKAVYAVDDKLIGPKGARAQCPKCKTLQIVKKPDASGLAPAAQPPAAPPAAPKPAAASPFDDLLGIVQPPSAPPAPAAAPKKPDPFAGLDLGDGGVQTLGLGPTPKPAPIADPFAGIPAAPRPSSTPAFELMAGAQGSGFDLFGDASKPLPDPFAAAAPAPQADPFAPAPVAPASADPFASLSAAPQPAPRPQVDPFAPGPAAPASADPFASLSAAPPPAPRPSAADPFGFGPPPSIAPPAQPAPSSNQPWQVGGAAANPGDLDLFGAAGVPQSTPGDQPVAHCRVCHKPIPDPFDGALGVCEGCRSKDQETTSPLVKPQKPPADASQFAPPAQPEIEIEKAPAPAARPARTGSVAYKPAERSGGAGKWLALVAVLGLAGFGGWAWFTKPEFLFKKPKPVVLSAIDKHLPDWTMAGMGSSGTAAEHLERARKAFLSDKPTSYLEAEEEYKAAIVADPQNLKAVAAYVESFAIGRGERAPAAGVAEARELISSVLSAKPDLSPAHRARANLLNAAGQTEDARKEAEEAVRLALPDEQAEALLTLGCIYLRKSAPIAIEKIDAALAKDKTLKRAYLCRGLASEYAGRYASALKDFDERLKLDPDQREALAAQARIYAKMGDYKSARTALATFASKHPNVGQPRVLLVQLAWAVERDLALAEKTLRELKADEARFDDQDRLELATLWVAVARERGDTKTSLLRAEEALKIDPAWGPAHFQKMLTLLATGQVDGARTELRAVEAKLDDSSRVHEYQGRIEAAAGNLDAAIAAFRAASEGAPSRMAPRLNLAAALVRKGELDMAWSAMRKALDADPASVAQLKRQVSDYFEAPVESVKGLAKAFEINSDEVNWLPRTYAAVAQYHAGEIDRAAAGLDKVLSSDSTSLASLIYRAQIELDRKRYDKAATFAQRAMKAERQCGVTFYLAGRALEGQGKPDHARQMYLAALERDPSLVPANARLGLLSLDEDKDGARKSLLQALTVEPDNIDVRVALFKLGY